VPLRWIVLPLAVAALLFPLGAAAYYAHEGAANRGAAERWRDRALANDRMLTNATRALNSRSDALNRTSARLVRSEADVDALEKRQRSLANEKARVEDDRAAARKEARLLADIATIQQRCTDGLAELLQAVTREDLAWVRANSDPVFDACESAQDELAALAG
jgi:septal ring factor EnvC (AmiA/AmiB activator)